MRVPPAFWIAATCVALAAGGLVWILGQGFGGHPLSIADATLANWPLVTSDGTDPWIVAARPPDSLITQLLQDVSRQSGRTLVPPPHPGLPLVLRAEFDDALQGVYGIDEVLRIARDAGVDTATFTPVCIARKVAGTGPGRAELYFIVFDAPAFDQMRVDLTPTQPEHAGIGMYDPSTVTPVLVVGATDSSFERWWPLTVNRATDCQATLQPAR